VMASGVQKPPFPTHDSNQKGKTVGAGHLFDWIFAAMTGRTKAGKPKRSQNSKCLSVYDYTKDKKSKKRKKKGYPVVCGVFDMGRPKIGLAPPWGGLKGCNASYFF